MLKASVRHCSGSVSLIGLLALSLPTPILAQGLAIYARTPTGLPETLFDADPAEASTQLADQCLNDGLSVVTREEGTVTCQLPDDREAGARADLGQAGRTGRPIFYRFQLEERGTASRVLASGWEEVPGFWGGTSNRAFEDPVFHNALVDLMVKAGGRLPPGTRFPNHAMIGAEFVARIRPEQSLEVMEVEADSPAMRAGLQMGDLVTRIANRRTRTLEDLNRSLVEAASAASFEIRFLREGREGVALLRSEFRPAVTAPVVAEAEGEVIEAKHAAPASTAPAALAQAGTAVPPPAPPYVMPVSAMRAYHAPIYTPAPVPPATYPAAQPYAALPSGMPPGGALPMATPPSAPAPAAPAPASRSFSVADELAKFATLLKDGMITQAEFDAQKARLLAQ